MFPLPFFNKSTIPPIARTHHRNHITHLILLLLLLLLLLLEIGTALRSVPRYGIPEKSRYRIGTEKAKKFFVRYHGTGFPKNPEPGSRKIPIGIPYHPISNYYLLTEDIYENISVFDLTIDLFVFRLIKAHHIIIIKQNNFLNFSSYHFSKIFIKFRHSCLISQ
jgi:hypothetical protein